MSQDTKQFSDQELFRKCREYGGNARMWMKKFAGLLPEVYQRHLYKKKGFYSIHHFAKVLAGMNERTVDTILHLADRLKDKPKLFKQSETGEVSWSKLEKVSFIAKPETDGFWAEKTKILPLHILEAYVTESRKGLKVILENNSENNSEIQVEAKPWETVRFSVSPELSRKLRLLKQKLEKERKTVMNWNEVLLEMANQMEEKTEENRKSRKIIQICTTCEEKQADEKEKIHEVTRHIPAAVTQIIQKRSDGTCEYPNCNRPGEIYHHTRRFAIKKNHDPNFIRLLCKAHEGILQMGLVENEEGMPVEWKLREGPEWYDLKNLVDRRVAEFRREPMPLSG